MSDTNEKFFGRADEHILLSNKQIEEGADSHIVNASFMYSVSRFNVWLSATGFVSSEEMAAKRDESIEFFVEQYRKMLVENIDDYIGNFDKYMNPPEGGQ